MKYILWWLFGVGTLSALGQRPKKMLKKLGSDPVIFIDSVNVDKSEMMKYQPAEIATFTMYTDSEAIELAGPDGKDGVIYIETKVFDKFKYWNYFKLKSAEYAKIVTSPEIDTTIQYILNKRILKKDFEGDLACINDDIFKEITVIDQQTLQQKYGIFDKSYGVIIKSDKPAHLYHKNRHF